LTLDISHGHWFRITSITSKRNIEQCWVRQALE